MRFSLSLTTRLDPHPIPSLASTSRFSLSPPPYGGVRTLLTYMFLILLSYVLLLTWIYVGGTYLMLSHIPMDMNVQLQFKQKNHPPKKNHRIPTYHTYTVVVASFGFACLPTCPESSITFELFHPMCYNIHRFCLLAPKFLLFLAQTHQQNPKHVNTTPRGSSPRGTERRVLLQDFHVRYIRACATLTHSST